MIPRARRAMRIAATVSIIALFALQFVQPDREAPPERSLPDAPPKVLSVLRRACFDCHSHETDWPWYSHVVPVAWFVAGHVQEGREALNFSRWPDYGPAKRLRLYENIADAVRAEEMPLTSYLLLHPGARLSVDDRERLLHWAGAAQREDSAPVTSSEQP